MENNDSKAFNNNFSANGKSFNYTPDPDSKKYLISLLIASGIFGVFGLYNIYKCFLQVDSILVLIQEIHSLNLDLVHFNTNALFEDLQKDLVVKYFRRLKALDELQLLLQTPPHGIPFMNFFFEKYSSTTNIHNLNEVKDFIVIENNRLFRGSGPPKMLMDHM